MVIFLHQAQGWIPEFGQVQCGIVLSQSSLIEINIFWINIFNSHLHIFFPGRVFLSKRRIVFYGFFLNNKGFFLNLFFHLDGFIVWN